MSKINTCKEERMKFTRFCLNDLFTVEVFSAKFDSTLILIKYFLV